MVAIIAGNGLGTQSSSMTSTGGRAQIGDASFGQSGEQVYVNALTGNLIIQDRDQTLLGRGVSSSLFRAYNSLGQHANGNWRAGSERSVAALTGTVNTAGSTITLTDWDGSAAVYQYDAARQLYVSRAPITLHMTEFQGPMRSEVTSTALATLSFDAAQGVWQWTDGDGAISENFDAAHGGRILSRQDRDGNAITYGYDQAGRLTRVTTAGGDVTTLEYNAAGQLVALSTTYRGENGQPTSATTVRYAYDTLGRFAQVIVDLSPLDGSIADGNVFTTTYTYDGASSRVASITQSDGQRLAFSYVSVNGEYRVATVGQSADGASMRVTTFSYDPVKRITTVTDPAGHVQAWYYDTDGRLKQIFSNLPKDSPLFSFNYDSDGNFTSGQNSNGAGISLVYDSHGNLLKTVDIMTQITRTYGANHEMLTETVVDMAKNKNIAVDYLSLTTRYVYDPKGHLRYTVSAEGRVTEYRYNPAGQRIAEIQYSGAGYDVSKLAETQALTETQLNAWVGQLARLDDAVRVDIDYDYRGQITNARDPSIPFVFVEPVYSFGEWISPHRLTHVQDVFWRPETDFDKGLYRCRSGYKAEFFAGASEDDEFD